MRVNLEIESPRSKLLFLICKLGLHSLQIELQLVNSFTAFRLSFNLEIESPRIKLLFLI
jgi:hypothetical protein